MPWWCLRCLCYDNKLFPLEKQKVHFSKDCMLYGPTLSEGRGSVCGLSEHQPHHTLLPGEEDRQRNTSGREWLDQTELYKTHGTILSEVIQEFLANSLTINYHKRPSAEQLLKYTFIEAYSHRSMKQIARNMLENLMKNC
ncbi:hypothetical protein Ahia01_001079600 [Argonauta hians]